MIPEHVVKKDEPFNPFSADPRSGGFGMLKCSFSTYKN